SGLPWAQLPGCKWWAAGEAEEAGLHLPAGSSEVAMAVSSSTVIAGTGAASSKPVLPAFQASALQPPSSSMYPWSWPTCAARVSGSDRQLAQAGDSAGGVTFIWLSNSHPPAGNL